MKQYSYVKRALLRWLSEDSRISVTTLAKNLKCSRNTIVSSMESMNKEFGIRYTLELDKPSLGIMQRHLWVIKFNAGQPDLSEMKSIFKNDPNAQFVAKTQGDFDLLIHIAAKDGPAYMNWGIETTMKLLKYKPQIKPSMIVMRHTGFLFLLNDLLETLDMRPYGLDELDKKILLLLNDNSRISMEKMAKKLDEEVETIRYRLRKLSKKKMIRRFTIMLEKPPKAYEIAFFMNLEFAPGLSQRNHEALKYYFGRNEAMQLTNSFQYLALLSGSHLFFGLGGFENEQDAFTYAIDAHRRIYSEDNPKIEYAKIINMIKGNLPVRNIDMQRGFKELKLEG